MDYKAAELFLTKEWDALKSEHSRFRDSRYLSQVISSILKLVDNPEVQQKLIGMRFLKQYASIIPVYLLKKYGYLDVFYVTLLRIVSFREVELLDAGFPCLLKILELDIDDSEEQRGQITQYAVFSYFDKKFFDKK